MPQMFPINWIILYFLFSLLFIFFIINNYFLYKSILKKNKNNIFLKNYKLNWKW